MTDRLGTGPDLGSENETALTTPDDLEIQSFDAVVQSVVNESQFMILSGRTPKSVIKTRPGRGGKKFSYVPHAFVVAILNRAFGFDWDYETMPYGSGDYFREMPADPANKRKGSIIVQGRVTVRIRNPNDATEVIAEIVKTATGEKEFVPGMTWGSMVKSAESDALKKAASKLGVALDLYWSDADDEYIPPSVEQMAARTAQRRVMEYHLEFPDASPREIADAIAAELGTDVPVNRVVKWIRET